MPIVTGKLVEITGAAIQPGWIPSLFFRLPREAVKGSMLLTTNRVPATLTGESFSVELVSTEGMTFTDGRPAFYRAEVEWRDPNGPRTRHNVFQREFPVSDAGGEIGEQAGEIVPAGSDIAIGLTQPDWPGTYYWLQATTGDPDVEATGSGNVYKVVG